MQNTTRMPTNTLQLKTEESSDFYDVHDNRGCFQQAYNITQALFRGCAYFGETYYEIIRPPVIHNMHLHPKPSLETKEYCLDELPWNKSQDSAGLCLCLHGLDATFRQWEKFTQQIPQQFPTVHYLAPTILHAGNCSLEDAAMPVVKIVKDYLTKFPGNHLFLIGSSNGARVASFLEVHLNPQLFQSGASLTVISIGGVHGGTKMMDIANRVCCDPCFKKHPAVRQELSFNSDSSLQLCSQLRDKQLQWKVPVTHIFYTTTEDHLVRPLSSTLPKITEGIYKIISGHTHETLVDAVLPEVIEWLKMVFHKKVE